MNSYGINQFTWSVGLQHDKFTPDYKSMCCFLVKEDFKKKKKKKAVLSQRSPTFLAPGAGFVEDSFSTDRAGDGPGGNASDGERQMRLRSLASCRAARFLTRRGPAPVRRSGVADPCT